MNAAPISILPVARPRPRRAVAASAGPAAFALFIVVNAALFIRPAELKASLDSLRIYEVAIIGCLLAGLPAVMHELRPSRWLQTPITAIALGLLPVLVISHLSHFNFTGAMDSGVWFGKILIYYLLLISVVNSPARLKSFLFWVAVFIAITATLPLLQFKGIISFLDWQPLVDRGDDDWGREVNILRLRGLGMFGDPNDLCHISAVGIVLGLYFLTDRSARWKRWIWLAPLAVLGYVVILTRSRGGFLALLAGVASLFLARYGWRKGLIVGAMTIPGLLFVIGGRQADISATEGTGQARVQLWNDSIELLKRNPLLGVGHTRLVEEVGQVAHNSFVQAYGETGLIGGTMFFGACYLALSRVHAMRPERRRVLDPELRRMQPYMMAGLAAYIAGMMSLTQPFAVATYLMLGLAVVYMRQASARPAIPPQRLDLALITRVGALSLAFLAVLYVFVRMTVRWG